MVKKKQRSFQCSKHFLEQSQQTAGLTNFRQKTKHKSAHRPVLVFFLLSRFFKKMLMSPNIFVFSEYVIRQLTRLKKMLSFWVSRGGGKSKISFFNFFQKLCTIKKIVLNKKVLYFYSGYFEKKSCLNFLILQTLGTKNHFFFQFPPHTIFETKHIGMIPTVQIFCIDRKDLNSNFRS